MRRGATRKKVFDFVRQRLECVRTQPTCREIGDEVGISAVAAWKHLQTLIGERKLVSLGRGKVALPETPDLSVAETDELRAELARRGVTLDALEQPKLPMDEGRPCAANFCTTRVKRGHLMCWTHWTALPNDYRDAILRAFRARDVESYQAAVEAARDYLGGFTRVVERVE